MRSALRALLASLLCVAGCAPTLKPSMPSKRWAIYYDTKLHSSAFSEYDLVVFDGRYYPALAPLRRANPKTVILAYVSIGEVHGEMKEKELLRERGELLNENSEWRSHTVDITSKKWQEMFIKQVDKAVADGFDGVMLDTVDSPLWWAEQQSPERHAAMKMAAVSLIQEIRLKHRNIKIMMNRGFTILPAVIPYLNYVLAESILTKSNNSSGHYSLFPPHTYAQVVAKLQTELARAEHLQLFTLDYWDVADVTGVERIYAAQRASGFHPYVTTKNLRQHTPEPTVRRTKND